MMLVGHETESMAKRYSILDEGMVTEFAGRLDGLGKFSESLGLGRQNISGGDRIEPMSRAFTDLSASTSDLKKPTNSGTNPTWPLSPNHDFFRAVLGNFSEVWPVPDDTDWHY